MSTTATVPVGIWFVQHDVVVLLVFGWYLELWNDSNYIGASKGPQLVSINGMSDRGLGGLPKYHDLVIGWWFILAVYLYWHPCLCEGQASLYTIQFYWSYIWDPHVNISNWMHALKAGLVFQGKIACTMRDHLLGQWKWSTMSPIWLWLCYPLPHHWKQGIFSMFAHESFWTMEY